MPSSFCYSGLRGALLVYLNGDSCIMLCATSLPGAARIPVPTHRPSWRCQSHRERWRGLCCVPQRPGAAGGSGPEHPSAGASWSPPDPHTSAPRCAASALEVPTSTDRTCQERSSQAHPPAGAEGQGVGTLLAPRPAACAQGTPPGTARHRQGCALLSVTWQRPGGSAKSRPAQGFPSPSPVPGPPPYEPSSPGTPLPSLPAWSSSPAQPPLGHLPTSPSPPASLGNLLPAPLPPLGHHPWRISSPGPPLLSLLTWATVPWPSPPSDHLRWATFSPGPSPPQGSLPS